MSSNGGWIDADSPVKLKRPRFASPGQSPGHDGKRSAGELNFFSSTSTDAAPAVNSSKTARVECKYDSKCYRRNETHLMEFKHPLLEELYRHMKSVNDFTRVPDDFNLKGADETVLLEQVKVLQNAGFEIPESTAGSRMTKTQEQTSNTKPQNSRSEAQDQLQPSASPSSSSSSSSTTTTPRSSDPISSLFEERRQRMKLKQQIQQRLHENGSINSVSTFSKESDVKNPRTMAEKWEVSCPLNFFLTKVRSIPVEKDEVLSASFTDLFDASFGEVKAALHINFQVEATWLFNQFLEAGLTGKPTWIIHGEDSEELVEGAKAFPWLKLHRAKSPFPYGHHHTKMSVVQYTDLSVRFFVYTANLVESDWDNRTQGIWISPKCPRVPSGSSPAVGESRTKFRSDVLQYLSTYPIKATAAWQDVVKYADCSDIKVYFVASAPITSQSSFNGFQFGIKKMEKILRSYEMDVDPTWMINVQCSSIGTLGASSQDWLINEFGTAMTGKDRLLRGPLNLVYPTEQNVKDSFDGVYGGGCLPYSAMTHMKQKWLYKHLFQWKADISGRTRAPPHIKSYSRWSPDQTKMAWVLLTSANLSKAAWGKMNKNGDRLGIMSWEAGVLFIPELFGSFKYFTTQKSQDQEGELHFPLYYDVPLVKYGERDRPWFFETLQLAISE